jgi:hypothetical protein
MALPSSLTTITVTGTFLKGDGLPEAGYLEFANGVALVSTGDNVIVSPSTIRERLNDAGQLSVSLPATNDPDWQPTGWTWQVTQQLDGGGTRTYSITLPYDAVGATVDLADLAPVQASQGTVTVGVQSVNGDPGPAVTLTAAEVGAETAGAVAAHTAAVDPHGDRAYADTQVATRVAKAGDTMTGALVTQGSFTVRDSATPTKQYRFRTLGSDLDIDFAGKATFVSVFFNPDFTGTQRTYLLFERDEQLVRASGVWRFYATNLFGAPVHQIDPLTGVAHLGAKNGLANIRICGFKASAGAPATGAWDAGDVVLDSAGVWHLCTAAGTPGTWT